MFLIQKAKECDWMPMGSKRRELNSSPFGSHKELLVLRGWCGSGYPLGFTSPTTVDRCSHVLKFIPSKLPLRSPSKHKV